MSNEQVMPKQTITRIVLADDHAMLREGLRRSLVAAGYEVVGEAGDGQQAIELAQSLRPDIVLMDVTMPILDGIEATRRITRDLPRVRVVMLTMHTDPQLAQSAAEAGAMGYLVKDCTTDDINEALGKAALGEKSFPNTASGTTSDKVETGKHERPVITQRESEVLQLIADGKTTTEAARTLYVSIKTVKNHLASAYAKLGAHDRTQAVLRAARLGLIKIQE